MATVKVQHEGQELEVELPAGYIAETDVQAGYVKKDFMQQELQRRLKGKADPDALLADDTFRARALEAWGVKPDAKGGKPSGEDVEKLHQTWSETHLKPVTEQLTKAQQAVERLQLRDRDAKILQAAATLVKDSLLKSPVEGHTPPIVHLLAPYLGYSEEHDEWFVKEGDGFAYATSPTKERPFKTAAEFLAEWAKDSTNADWLKDQRQRGARLGQPGQDGKGTPSSKPTAQWSTAEKVAYIKEHGNEKWEELLAQQPTAR